MVARHVLNTKKYTRDDAGNIMSYVPGVPEGMGVAPQQPAPAPGQGFQAPMAAEPLAAAPTSPRGLSLEKKATPVDISPATNTIMGISELINDAAQAGETITGAAGTAKRLGGGVARQLRFPVSGRSEALHRKLTTLKGIVGPLILQEKRLSETERKRLDDIVGNVDAFTDDQALRESLQEVVRFLMSIEGS